MDEDHGLDSEYDEDGVSMDPADVEQIAAAVERRIFDRLCLSAMPPGPRADPPIQIHQMAGPQAGTTTTAQSIPAKRRTEYGELKAALDQVFGRVKYEISTGPSGYFVRKYGKVDNFKAVCDVIRSFQGEYSKPDNGWYLPLERSV